MMADPSSDNNKISRCSECGESYDVLCLNPECDIGCENIITTEDIRSRVRASIAKRLVSSRVDWLEELSND